MTKDFTKAVMDARPELKRFFTDFSKLTLQDFESLFGKSAESLKELDLEQLATELDDKIKSFYREIYQKEADEESPPGIRKTEKEEWLTHCLR